MLIRSAAARATMRPVLLLRFRGAIMRASSRLRRRNAASVSAAVSTLAVTKSSAAAAAAVVATGCRSTTTWSL